MSPADPAPLAGAAPILQFPANYPPPPYAPPNPLVRVRHEFPLAVLELGRLLSYGMIAVGAAALTAALVWAARTALAVG